MKQLSLILIYLSVFNCVNFGQNTIYFDRTGNILKTKEKAEYFKIEKEDGDNIKNVSEFYISGNKKANYNLIVKSVRNKPKWVINGEYLEWYQNGVLHKKIDYLNGQVNTSLSTYWPNGQLKRSEKYDESGHCTTKCYNEQGGKIGFYPYYSEAKFPGGKDSIYSFIRRNIKKECMSDTTIKTVRVGFCIEKDGSVSNICLIKRQDSIFNQEALRIISGMPKWIPASEDGENTVKMVTQDVSFGTLTANHIYSVIEQMPTFKDGQASINQYISSHLEYPKEAIKNKIEGTVFLRFIIDSNGKVSKPSILRGIGGGCDEEAIRIISEMPTWNSGKQKGKPVSVWYTLPIQFKLQ